MLEVKEDLRMTDGEELFEPDDIEAYCVRCRESIVVQDPQPVWTRKGMPATRGECPTCGGTVFRMGMTEAHSALSRPDAIQVAEGGRKRAKLTQDTAYVLYAEADEEFAQQIAVDLQKAGIASWLHEDANNTSWAGGVHPALSECNRMVFVLSPAILDDQGAEAAWRFFKDKRKPIFIAQITPADPPDAIRRSARFDFARDYKAAFRQLIQGMSE
jgi:hypothetical protein